jgi:hypothetical protein
MTALIGQRLPEQAWSYRIRLEICPIVRHLQGIEETMADNISNQVRCSAPQTPIPESDRAIPCKQPVEQARKQVGNRASQAAAYP